MTTILAILVGLNLVLLVVNVVRAILLQRKPLVDRIVVTGTITEVFRGGSGLRIAYKMEDSPYTVLQINKGVNALGHEVSPGMQIPIHVNPFRHSNVTLTPRPVRDERGFMTWIMVQIALVPLTVIAILVSSL